MDDCAELFLIPVPEQYHLVRTPFDLTDTILRITSVPDFSIIIGQQIETQRSGKKPAQNRRQKKESDRLYKNDGAGHFTDVSEEAGLQFDIGFGLNPQVGDLNNDGWPDVYVNNDFNVPDPAYVNNGNGTFTESRDKLFKHISFNSTGSDMADLNNYGLSDLMTLDMNPEDNVRSKITMAMTSIPQFELMVEKGYHHQYMHNSYG